MSQGTIQSTNLKISLQINKQVNLLIKTTNNVQLHKKIREIIRK